MPERDDVGIGAGGEYGIGYEMLRGEVVAGHREQPVGLHAVASRRFERQHVADLEPCLVEVDERAVLVEQYSPDPRHRHAFPARPRI